MQKNIYENYASMGSNTNPIINVNDYIYKYYKNFFLKELPENKSSKILEIGCGEGKFLHFLNLNGYKNTFGIDIGSNAINIAKEFNILNVECIDSISFLNNKTETFDVIVLIDVLEHMEVNESINVLKACYKALKQNGKILMQVPNAIAPLSPHRHHDITHLRAYTTFSLSQTLNAAGFSTYSIKSNPMFVHGIKSLIRKILWNLLIQPLIKLFMLISYGNTEGGIYTSSIITIGRKN
ncbi:MAG: hypothetical protein A2888_01410 [Chlamydiae bacterium RIFCSPLOWO2_01_FULL_28_7]|nr:MAG: hypothetical protein A2888_01410 [Chlamydiae bacterium RIFCSPLOWO2_01_FULL_28_7]